MIKHPISYEKLITYAAGQLDAAERSRVAAHLAECRTCTRIVARFQAIRTLYREGDYAAPPASSIARAQAVFALNRRVPTSDWRQRVFGRLPSARSLLTTPVLAGLLVVVVLFFAIVDMLVPTIERTIPGDALYPVKTTLEDVRLAVPRDSESKVRVELAIANARVQELNALVAQGRYDQVPGATQDLEHHIQDVTSTLAGAAAPPSPQQTELARRVQNDLSEYSRTLSTLAETTSGDVKPQLEHAATVSVAAQTVVQNKIVEPVTAPATTGSVAQPATPTNPGLADPRHASGSSSAMDGAAATPTNALPPNMAVPPAPATLVIPNEQVVPTATRAPALPPSNTNTPIPPSTAVPLPSSTPIPPPTPTSVPLPTSTPMPVPTSTPVPPTIEALPTIQAIPIIPPSTPAPAPTDTPLPPPTSPPPPPPTNTPVPATSTPVPVAATATKVPSTSTPAPAATATPHPTSSPPATLTPVPIATITPHASVLSGPWDEPMFTNVWNVFLDSLSISTD